MSNFESHSFLDTESNTFAATLYEQRRYAKLPKENRFEEGCFRRTFYVLEIRATLELALQSISRCCRHRDKTTCAIAPSRENFQVDCLCYWDNQHKSILNLESCRSILRELWSADMKFGHVVAKLNTSIPYL